MRDEGRASGKGERRTQGLGGVRARSRRAPVSVGRIGGRNLTKGETGDSVVMKKTVHIMQM